MGGLPSGPLGSISNIMNRRARSTPRFGSLLAGLAAATLAPLARPARAANGVFAPVPATLRSRTHARE